ncbi:MAG: ribosomal protein S18-alanine N-acetyltransferase [Nitrospiraceae bacterium]|nr:ribosomal protein S18-alanine N-acetyltransferase [Nitrospiraceae bacterium]
MTRPDTVIFEPMDVHHIAQILDIENRSFSTPWSAISFRNEIFNPDGIAFVAVPGPARNEAGFEANPKGDNPQESPARSETGPAKAILGYICAECRLGEGHILNVAVHPAHRRRGLARFMLRAVLEEMRKRGCYTVYLEVRMSNTAAVRLYEEAGFRQTGRRKLYYVRPFEDAVLMQLEMKD